MTDRDVLRAQIADAVWYECLDDEQKETAEKQADAVLAVLEPALAQRDAENERLREVVSQAWAECDDGIRDHERGFKDAAIQGLRNIRLVLDGGQEK